MAYPIMRVVVTGGRTYGNAHMLFSVLDELHNQSPITELIEGGADGADALARSWAVSRGVPNTTVAADWRTYGPSAGPIRNGVMLDSQPDLVVAFPGGRGTKNCVVQAWDRGIMVKVVT